jgi:uncharacterized protein (TIGR03086 family)
MDDPRDMHRRGGDLAAKVISQITRAQLGLPTPCTDWDVKDVIAHIVTGQRRFAAKLSGELEPDEGGDVIGDHPAADFRASLAALNGVFDQPGFLDRTIPTPFGEGPAAQFISIRTAELTLHAWDLAAATAQSRVFDHEVVAFASAAMHTRPIPRSLTGPFAPEQALRGGILTDADLLAAFAGRKIPEPSQAWHLPEENKATPETGVSEPLR